MFTGIKTLVPSIALLVVLTGCSLDQQQRLEQENSDLASSLRQTRERLDQSQTREKKQSEMLKAFQDKIANLEKKVADLEMLKTELRKQKEFAEAELTRQKAEAQKQAALAENYQAEMKSLNEQLIEAREMIRKLKGESEKSSLGSEPVEK